MVPDIYFFINRLFLLFIFKLGKLIDLLQSIMYAKKRIFNIFYQMAYLIKNSL